MSHLNVEIKARCDNADPVRKLLTERGADYEGTDHQVDTYFNCPTGRLKLREGQIEYVLIYYDRPDSPGPKKSVVTVCQVPRDPALKAALTAALGIRAVVEKTREIYYVGNVKFHIDTVAGLGCFVEIEAIDADGTIGAERLRAQCELYVKLLGIRRGDLQSCSYSDMLT